MGEYLIKNKKELFVFGIVNILGCLSVLSMAFVIDYLIESIMSADITWFVTASVVVISYIAIDTIMDYAVEIVNEKLVQKVMKNLRSDLLTRINREPLAILNKKGGSYFLSKFSNELAVIKDDYLLQILSMYNDIILFVLAIVASVFIQPAYTIIMVVLSLIPLIHPYFTKNILQKHKKTSVEANLSYFQKIEEVIRSFSVLRLYGAYSKIQKQIEDENDNVEKQSIQFIRTSKRVGSLSYGIRSTVNMAAWIVGGYYVVVGRIDLGSFFALKQLVNYIAYPMQSLSSGYIDMISAKEVKDEIISYINSDDSEEEKIELNKLNSIRFDNVSLSNNHREILKGVNFQIEENKKYIVIGESGSGKTTLINMVLGVESPTSGEIYINNIPLNKINKLSLYSRMAVLEQKTSIFSGSMRENVSMFNPSFDTEEIVRSMRSGGLKNWLNKNKSIDTKIGLNNNNLSGGEERRVDLSRLFLHKNKDFLFFDEPTTGLDRENIEFIEKTISKIQYKTIFYVTHTYNQKFIESFDFLIQVNDGEVSIVNIDSENKAII